MRVLVFDTETTGLFPPRNEIAKYPYIVQISWFIYDFGDNKITFVFFILQGNPLVSNILFGEL